MTELLEFLKSNCPEAWHAWRRKSNHPTPDTLIGRTLRSLRPGYGGRGDQILKVDGYKDGRLQLSHSRESGVYTTPFELEVRQRGILDHFVDYPTRSAWYLDFEVLPDTIVVCLQGPPGSGKTTLSKGLEDKKKKTFAQFTRITPDEIGANKWMEDLKEAIRKKDKFVVVDRCHLNIHQRGRTLDCLHEFGDKVFTILLTLPNVEYAELENRIKQDTNHKYDPEKRLTALRGQLKVADEVSQDEKWGCLLSLDSTENIGPLWQLLNTIR